jgi:branched-chain amino acid transport system permease protein
MNFLTGIRVLLRRGSPGPQADPPVGRLAGIRVLLRRGSPGPQADPPVSPLVRGLAGLLGTAVALALLGHFSEDIGLPVYFLVLTATILFWTTQATSWNLLSGFAGYFSFGQGAYVAVGAYATAVLTGRHGVNFFYTIPLGGLLGGVLALLIGAVAFRLRGLRGEIFALLTLAVPFILAAYARITNWVDGGQGTTIPLPEYPDWVGDFQHLLFLLDLAVATVAVGVALAIHRSRFGRGLAAVRDAEDAAEVLGVPTFRYKLSAIVLGGVLGGAGGAIFAVQLGFVAVESVFNLTIPLFVIVMSVLGGRTHWLGPVIGATLIVTLQDRLAAENLESWSAIILGGLLAVLVVAASDGLYAPLRAHPWPALAAFLVVTAAFLLAGTVATIGALLFGMLAAAAAAIVTELLRPGRPSGAAAPVPLARRRPQTATESGERGDRAQGRLRGGLEAREPRERSERREEGPLVACENVTRYFGGVRALENVSFAVGRGEIVGLVGPNGSGKTTLVNLLCGAIRPTRGTVMIGGRATSRTPAHRIAHAGVARTYQIPKPFASMTVRDNVAMAVMFGRDGASLPVARRVADGHLATVRLGHLAAAYPRELNLHQRQLLEMARAIAADPTVLLLDEALAGLNPAEIDDAVGVIRAIHDSGISIIVVEHLLRVVRGLATRVVVLDRGTRIADGEPDAVLSDPAVVAAYLGRQRA